MGLAWICPICGGVASMARVEAGVCIRYPRHAECPLRPEGAALPATAPPGGPDAEVGE
jgi:hypothetical protein